ncbi:MAG: CocE/NonD family hydrolase [Deltaproteobacteria bacterium]|nr:CocE/NonD family hydrolase [Deltaproteobacteria bacterium]MBW2052836.1 CocE/NonD family hydrolase [Deltaproteobacteria bacterium]MBW2141484.1 CocE/NonD family hydrolase [Deltaproteobacteria bacterium]MBW2322895.1 CocE/NonD family hydrolase [Deltaproteobacteria bacterium]
MSSTIRIDQDVPMEMRDGVILRADVYRPDDGEKHPAILMRTPYNKTLAGNNDYLTAFHAASAGYAMVLQDTRGRFASEGEFTAMMPEGLDGYDTIEWLAAQPWCDGNVGMAGGSYLGRIQWETAMEAPPHLKAIAPSICTAGPLSDTRLSGVIDLEQSISWYATMTIDMIEKLRKQGKDVSKMRSMVIQALFNIDDVCNYLPLNEIPHFQFEGLSEGFAVRIGDAALANIKSEEDLYWAYEKVKVPCLHSSGWYDLFADSLFKNFLNMREKGGSKEAREGQHVLCGPWAHGGASLAYAGDLHFGPTGSTITALAMERHITFFNKYLKGIEPDPRHLPAVRYFVMGRNRWHSADSWPLPQTDWQRYYFHSRGQANSAAGNGLLNRDAPGSEPPDTFLYNPMFPVRTRGGRNLPTGMLVPGPLDQTHIEKRSDVLCYTTPELKEGIEVTGPLTLHLFASTSAKDTDFTAKLIDVHPDGSAYNVAEGCIRTRYRKSLLQPELISPGGIYEYTINMGAAGIVFGRGHRIRIDVSSSNFPRIDRNMNTGNAFGVDTEGVSAIQTIYHNADYSSYIDLPVVPASK